MAFPKVKLSDDSGNTVDVTSNALDVNIAGGASIDIGDVEILGHSTSTSFKNSTVGTSSERLTTNDQPCKHVDIMAHIDNTGIIYVGGSGVTSANGIGLYAGDVYSIDTDNLDNLYVISTVSGDDINIARLG